VRELWFESDRGLRPVGRWQFAGGNVIERDVRGSRPAGSIVVDQQVSSDRQQPGAERGSPRVEALPGSQRALECLLSQILGIVLAVQPVGEEPVNP
jgi:hypothetical protein